MPGVVDAEFVHPSLEQVFLTYYEEDRADTEGGEG
jgi:hypothetical protein